ncbi:MAG: hypothetical protein K2X87_33835, partial [Gemmataceae bacterium]|nr:hypothetical protein [Gemmataceae bacterium]
AAGGPVTPPDRPGWRDYWKTGPTSATACGAGRASRAGAAVNVPHKPGISLTAVSAAPPGGPDHAVAAGQWVDVIRVATSGPAPSALRVVVEVDGTLTLDLGAGDLGVLVGVACYHGAGLVADPYTEPTPARTAGGRRSNVYLRMEPAAGPGERPTYATEVRHADDLRLGGLSADPGEAREFDGAFPAAAPVRWTAEFEVPYSSELGGYRLNLYATAKVLTAGGSKAEFRGTARLAAVTLPGGAQAPGPVTFESGFTPATVGP